MMKLVFLVIATSVLFNLVQCQDAATCKYEIGAFKSRLTTVNSMTILKYRRMVGSCTYLFDGSTQNGYLMFKGFA